MDSNNWKASIFRTLPELTIFLNCNSTTGKNKMCSELARVCTVTIAVDTNLKVKITESSPYHWCSIFPTASLFSEMSLQDSECRQVIKFRFGNCKSLC